MKRKQNKADKVLKERVYKERVGQDYKLRATKLRGKYKATDNYLDAIWRKNKEYLEDRIESFNDPRSKKTIWKQKVKEYLKFTNPETGKKYTVAQAIDAVQYSELITSGERRRAEVSFSRMRGERKKGEKMNVNWVNIRKAIGWRNVFSPNNVIDSWSEGKQNYYRYYDPATGKDVMVVETISPKAGTQMVEVIDYGDWLEHELAAKKDTKSQAIYNNVRAMNQSRKDEINRIREIMQGKKYIPYK